MKTFIFIPLLLALIPGFAIGQTTFRSDYQTREIATVIRDMSVLKTFGATEKISRIEYVSVKTIKIISDKCERTVSVNLDNSDEWNPKYTVSGVTLDCK